jgi:hypothetical protein
LTRGFSDALFRFDLNGLKRAAAILLGVASAGAGLIVARLSPPPSQLQGAAKSLTVHVKRRDV